MSRESQSFEVSAAQWQHAQYQKPDPFFREQNQYAPNVGLICSEGNKCVASGKCDWSKADSAMIDAHTLCPEASIAKIRLTALAFSLQQEGLIDLNQNAYEFFSQPFVRDFLQVCFPHADIHRTILTLTGTAEAQKARLIEFLLHTSGVGSLGFTRIGKKFAPNAAEKPIWIPEESLSIEHPYQLHEVLPTEPPMGRGDLGKTLPPRHGVFQYSNLGFMLLAVALEAAYWQKHQQHKNYQQLYRDFLYHPIEGRASKAQPILHFHETKFPSEIRHAKSGENIAVLLWFDAAKAAQNKESKGLANVALYDGYLASAGTLSSTHDLTLFFQEFFRGFPGTAEYGQDVNRFFTPESIACMRREWERYRQDEILVTPPEKTDALPEKIRPKPGHKIYPGPGFVVETNAAGDITSYHKAGLCFGVRRYMEYDTRTGVVSSITRILENVTDHIAKTTGLTVEELQRAYTSSHRFNRQQLVEDFQKEAGVEIIQNRVARQKQLHPVSSALTARL